MNIERFHNQLALHLGYDRIVNNKRISIMVDYKNPNAPWIGLGFPEGETEGFYASESIEEANARFQRPELWNMIKSYNLEQNIAIIINASHQAFLESANIFCFGSINYNIYVLQAQ